MRGNPVSAKMLWALGSVLVLTVVALTPRYLDLVTLCGHYIPQEDLTTDYLKGVLWAMALGLSILCWPVSGPDKRRLLLAWSVKVVLVLFLMLFYEQHYGSDANMYFGTARNLPAYLVYGFTGGTVTMINLARMHNHLIPDSYHAMKISCAMIGLAGSYLFYRSAETFLGRRDRRLFWIFTFFPGIAFWSSILGKDPLVFFGIALYTYGVTNWCRRRSLLFFVPVAAGICIAVSFREWLGPMMLLPMGLFLVKGARGVWQRGAILLVTVVFLYFSANALMERFRLSALQDVLSTLETASEKMSSETAGSAQQMELDFSSPLSIACFLPLTTFTALFRPLPGEILNPFGLLAGMENAILVFLLCRAVKRTRLKELKDPLLLWALLFLSLWAVVNGVVSSTNLGLAVRYKLQVLPILLGLLLYLSRERGQETPRPRAIAD